MIGTPLLANADDEEVANVVGDVEDLPDEWFGLQKKVATDMALDMVKMKATWPWWSFELMCFFQRLFHVGLRPYLQDLKKVQAVLEEDEHARETWHEER